jgi:Methyltransferase domain
VGATTVVTRHEFLVQLHQLLKPKLYLEIGVQTGASLDLAIRADLAIGIDPEPLVSETGNQKIFKMLSKDYFVLHAPPELIDLAFIDGSHLFEDALLDFINVEEHCGPRSVVVFDDVLPYNQAIAERYQPPGDWTGDVWKVHPILMDYREDLTVFLVDTQPTGSLVVMGFEEALPLPDRRNNLIRNFDKIVREWSEEGSDVVPRWVLERDTAVQPDRALKLIEERICESQ